MRKKFIISESEKNEIRKMYGLLTEQETLDVPNLPYVVPGSWTAIDCDSLHAFQSRQVPDPNDSTKKITEYYGDMNAKVAEALKLFWQKVPVKVTKVDVRVNGMTVSYDVTIDKSPDGIGFNGFTSRGGGCGSLQEAKENRFPDTESYMKYRATKEKGKSETEIKEAIQGQSNVGKLNYFEKIGFFYDSKIPEGLKIYQVFYQYQTDNPPEIKSQETLRKEKEQKELELKKEKELELGQEIEVVNQDKNVINNISNLNVSSDGLKELREKLQNDSKGKKIDPTSVRINLDNLTYDFKEDETKKPVALVSFIWSENLDNEDAYKKRVQSTKNNNPIFDVIENTGTWANGTKRYTSFVFIPKINGEYKITPNPDNKNLKKAEIDNKTSDLGGELEKISTDDF